MKTLEVQDFEIDVATLLCDVVDCKDDKATKIKAILDDYKIVGEVCFFSTQFGQKYVIAVCKRHSSRVLFCAFAGTYLSGDWEDASTQYKKAIGFSKRASDIPREGIERLAQQSRASRIVFCGHGLGGAVAHLVLILFLSTQQGSRGRFADDDAISVGFGAPHFGDEDLLDSIKEQGWVDRIINVVDPQDPIPRVMNLAAALCSVDDGPTSPSSRLFSACLRFLNSREKPVELARAIQKGSPNSVSAWLQFVSIGRCVYLENETVTLKASEAHGLSEQVGTSFRCREDWQRLAQDLRDRKHLSRHGIPAYRKLLEARGETVSKMCLRKDWADLNNPGEHVESPISPSNLKPEVQEVLCETLKKGGICYRLIRVCGINLDFADIDTVDPDEIDGKWSRDAVEASQLSRRNTNVLVMEQELKEAAIAKPREDITILVRSDVVTQGYVASKVKAELPRNKCHDAVGVADDALAFYGGQFFLDTQQHAWIMKKLFNDDRLSVKLQDFQEEADRNCGKDTTFLSMQASWKRLEDVGTYPGNMGNMRKTRDAGNMRKTRDALYDWIVPPEGLPLQTEAQVWCFAAIVASSFLLGGGVISAGGLGVMMGVGRITGGWVSAALLSAAGGGVAQNLCWSRLRTNYYVMLQDLVKVYTGWAPRSRSEFQLEEELLKAHDAHQKGKKTTTPTKFPTFDDYDPPSQKKIRARIAVIRKLHEVKKARMKGTVISVCGPRDSGKTTLLSQLLQKPNLALATGITGGEGETRVVTPYSFPSVPGFAVLDTPGVTGPETGIRGKFEKAALNLCSCFVYIREYAGLPTEVDVAVIQKILQNSSRSRDPKILVCLNRCVSKLTEDAAGEIFDVTAAEEKKKWQESLAKLQSSETTQWTLSASSASSISVEFVELKGDRRKEDSYNEDERTKGIWTTSSIGTWITQNAMEGTEENCGKVHAFLSAFDYPNWQEGVRKCRKERKEQEEREREATQRMLDALNH
ncbi:expressed unknown protein [Seminavis robusta]|uniref:Fungal lipase-type domain-containing protein n=1 Tax=Seminavis robusta TaxID=568900 RepID=A0A9N8EEF2_9STRA|nr:expressed unknown protein [Seminavis robusta]|eukprot:Sro970_g226380.1 n/a (983) ;mRNA; f:26880-29828